MILKYYSERERSFLAKRVGSLPGVILRYGGPGSGYHGHEGRPGLQGGSSPSGTTGHGVGARGIRSAGPGEYGAAGGGGGGSGGFKPEERHEYAIADYCEGVAYDLNDALRSGQPIDPGLQETMNNLDEFLLKSKPVGEPLHRGIVLGSPSNFQPGMEISDKGYSSFSEDMAVSLEFVQDAKFPVIFTAPRGGAPSVRKWSHLPEQEEAIFPRNQKFRVSSVEKEGKFTYVEVEPI